MLRATISLTLSREACPYSVRISYMATPLSPKGLDSEDSQSGGAGRVGLVWWLTRVGKGAEQVTSIWVRVLIELPGAFESEFL